MKPDRLLLVSTLWLTFAATAAGAQTWPTKPIRAVIPIAPGSITDVVPRLVFEQLSTQLGQPVVVENRPGGGTAIGAGAVAKAEPDGYTLLANSSAHVIAPSLNPNLSYDPARDFAAVIPLGIMPSVLVVSPAKGHKTLADFIKAAKAKPDAMSFASAGVGTGTHLSAMQFQNSTGVQAVHVPVKGGPEAFTEVMSGRVDFFFAPVGVALPLIREGKLAALAVNGMERASVLPDVPTTAEAGLVNAEYAIWLGLFLPSKTPRDIVEKLHRETRKALEAPKVKERLASLGIDPMVLSPAAFEAQVVKEIAANAALVKTMGLKSP